MTRSTCLFVAALAGGAAMLSQRAEAADISAYTAAKGRLFSQIAAAAPAAAPQPFVFRATVEGNLSAITDATVQSPSAFGGAMDIPENEWSTRRELSIPFPDLTTMGFLFSNGEYRFTFDLDTGDFELAQLTLDSTAFPAAIPQIANFTAAQSVNDAADFTLTWNALGDASGWGLIVAGPDGEVFAESGTGTSVTIPAGTLEADTSYTARLRFAKELDRDTSAVVGAVGTAELFNETEFVIGTGSGTPGGDDTTPPFLFSTSPANGASGVAIDATVSFTFSEVMTPTQSIEWTGAAANAFSYQWTAGGRVLAAKYNGDLPAKTAITWRLNPTDSNPANFKDAAGNALPSGLFQGTFITGSSGGTNDPCDPDPVDTGRGFGFLAKGLNYVQTGNNPPALKAGEEAYFTGSYRGASNQTVTAVSLSGPSGNKTFQNAFGFFLFNEEYASAAALEAGAPAGSYTIAATGAGSATVPLGSVAQIPVPRILNLVELGQMNVGSAFTLNFSPFSGAGANDSIFISIYDEAGGEFHAPDLCRNIALPNTATSLTIPAGTFKSGVKYSGSISFTKSGGFDTNSIPGTGVSSSAMVGTEFGFTNGGSQTTPPRWTTIRRNPNGTLSFTVTADTGARLIVESTTGFTAWTPVATNTVAGGSYELLVDPKLAGRAMYRAKVQ